MANNQNVKLIGKSLEKGTVPSANNLANSKLLKSMNIQDPGTEPCIDHYWISYWTATGEIIDVVYTGSNGSFTAIDGSIIGDHGGLPPLTLVQVHKLQMQPILRKTMLHLIMRRII